MSCKERCRDHARPEKFLRIGFVAPATRDSIDSYPDVLRIAFLREERPTSTAVLGEALGVSRLLMVD